MENNFSDIFWIQKENISPNKYITVYLSNKQIYINQKILDDINFNFDFIKLGINYSDKTAYIIPIPTHDLENYNKENLTSFNYDKKTFSHTTFQKEIVNIIDKKYLNQANSIKIKSEIKKLDDIGLSIISYLDDVYPN